MYIYIYKQTFLKFITNVKIFQNEFLFHIYLFEVNFLCTKFKICLGAAQKHSEGRGLMTSLLDS
jgi:hypothetical protein